MNTLLIDTHFKDIIVILYKDSKVVNKREVINKKNNSEYMFPTIKEVIDGVTLNEIIVVNGPGSFTGVRLGCTIAKTLAYTLNIPIKTVSSLEVMAISNDVLNVALSDDNGYYIAKFDKSYNPTSEYEYISNKDMVDLDKYTTTYKIDEKKIFEYMKRKSSINPHGVKPLYIKRIGVEIGKNCSN